MLVIIANAQVKISRFASLVKTIKRQLSFANNLSLVACWCVQLFVIVHPLATSPSFLSLLEVVNNESFCVAVNHLSYVAKLMLYFLLCSSCLCRVWEIDMKLSCF